MTDTIVAGSILVERGTQLPNSLLLQNESLSNGWAPVKDVRFRARKGNSGSRLDLLLHGRGDRGYGLRL